MLFVHLKFRLVKPGIDPEILSQGTISVSRAHWKMGERRLPQLRYDFHDDQRAWARRTGEWSSPVN